MAYLLILLFSCFGLGQYLCAKDFGIHGKVFPILEEDLLEFIKDKTQNLSESELTILQTKIQKHFVKQFNEPRPLDLRNAKEYRSRFFDPSVNVNNDILDHTGKIIVKKGTNINPLEFVSLPQELIFFDSTQISQLTWARNQEKNAKWILVKGKPLELEKTEGRPVYFDQFGVLTKKLSIQCIPSKVSQEGKLLKIEEFLMKETSCVN